MRSSPTEAPPLPRGSPRPRARAWPGRAVYAPCVAAGALAGLSCGARSVLDPWAAPPPEAAVLDGMALGDASPAREGGCEQACVGPVVTLASGLNGGGNIAVDGTHVYYSTNDSVASVPIDGGVPTTLASGLSPIAMAIDSTSVYWTNWQVNITGPSPGGAVMKVPLLGGTADTVVGGDNGSDALAVDSTSVYWAPLVAGTVNQRALGGGRTTTLVTGQSYSAPGEPGFVLIAVPLVVRGGTLFWSVSDDPGSSPLKGWVASVPVSGGVATTLVAGVSPVAMAVDDQSVYWLDEGGGGRAVLRAPVDGGASTTLASESAPGLVAMAVHGSDLYLLRSPPSGGQGALLRLPVRGGALTTLASFEDATPTALAVDDTSVYWINAGTGSFGAVVLDGTVVKLTPTCSCR